VEDEMNRICPTEEILSEYLSGCLSHEDRLRLERHLAGCDACRRLLVEAHEILKKPALYDIGKRILDIIKGNYWLTGAAVGLFLSFVFKKYFFQFLAVSTMMSAKWIVDSRAQKTLVMIHEVWKRNKEESYGKKTDNQG
jgi:hypothetical protein